MATVTTKTASDTIQTTNLANNETNPTHNEAVDVGEESDAGSETSLVGYISIKDFAYEVSNPLHYGYYNDGLEDTEEGTDTGAYNGDDSYVNDYEDADNYTNDDDLERRQSVILPNDYIVNKRAIALYDFEPENDNELGFKEGDTLFISYRHGQGWLVAENQERNQTGLVPEEFVSFVEPSKEEQEEDNNVARPFYLTQFITNGLILAQDEDESENEQFDDLKHDNTNDEDEWEDIDNLQAGMRDKLTLQDTQPRS